MGGDWLKRKFLIPRSPPLLPQAPALHSPRLPQPHRHFRFDHPNSCHSSSLQPLRYRDRKSTRLNSSHQIISYAVFCLKKKNNRKYIELNIQETIDQFPQSLMCITQSNDGTIT